MVDATYGDKALSMSQINPHHQSHERGEEHLGPAPLQHKEKKQICNIVASIAAAIERDQGVTVHELAGMHGPPVGTVPTILTDDLGLVKTSAPWVLIYCQQPRKRSKWTTAVTRGVPRILPGGMHIFG